MSSRQSKGFTLVELMLSMAFVSLLLLAIALLVIQISNMYNKGLTLRAVNESGQLIASDLQETLNTSVPSAAPLSPHYVSSMHGTTTHRSRIRLQTLHSISIRIPATTYVSFAFLAGVRIIVRCLLDQDRQPIRLFLILPRV
jgi:hypothetical protein